VEIFFKKILDEDLLDLLCNNTNNILAYNSIFLKRNFIFASLNLKDV